MKSVWNTLRSVIVYVLFTTIFIVVFIIGILFLTATSPDLNQMERDFQENRETLNVVVEYFIQSEFDSISIRFTDTQDSDCRDIEMFAGLETGWIPISDENISDAICLLFQQGYRGIHKREGGVSFLRWSTRDHGRGIVYSINGETPKESELLPFLTEIEPLSVEGWYFYVENFNEWRRQQ